MGGHLRVLWPWLLDCTHNRQQLWLVASHPAGAVVIAADPAPILGGAGANGGGSEDDEDSVLDERQVAQLTDRQASVFDLLEKYGEGQQVRWGRQHGSVARPAAGGARLQGGVAGSGANNSHACYCSTATDVGCKPP